MTIYLLAFIISVIVMLLCMCFKKSRAKKYILLVSTIIAILSASNFIEIKYGINWKIFYTILGGITFLIVCFRIYRQRKIKKKSTKTP